MDDMHQFYLLKQQILTRYREAFPYYSGSIQNFGNREIAQLIDLVEKECHERVSEKWVYTHLKPGANEKLPRRDMLDIFCKWTGYAGWEEFVYKNTTVATPKQEVPIALPGIRDKRKKAIVIILVVAGMLITISAALISRSHDVTICLKDKYTQKAVEADKVSLFLLENGTKKKLQQKDNCFLLKTAVDNALVLVESPYYKTDTLEIAANDVDTAEFELQPDDYAMMLRAYMNGNVADWNKRRRQLGEIISDDAVIQEVMFDEIGVEFLNKEEFINKVTTPGSVVKNMEVVEVDYKEGKIIALKFIQK